MERKRTVPFDKLIDQIAQGRQTNALSSLAARLAALNRQIDGEGSPTHRTGRQGQA